VPLTIDRVRRAGGLAGLLFVIVALVALFLPGTPPKADEVSKISSYLTDKRGSILASDFLLGIAFTFFLIFVGALRTRFGAGDRDGLRPGSIALAGGVAGAVLIFAGASVLSGVVFQVAKAGDANLNHALYDVSNDLFIMAGFAFAVFFLGAALAIRATGAFPSLLAPAALVIALLSLISCVGLFATSGFFAIGGAFGFIVPVLSVLWVLTVSVLLLRPESAGSEAQATART
jgi:hypothetical protein